MFEKLIELLQYYVYPNKKDEIVWEYKIVKKYDVKFFKGYDYKIVKAYDAYDSKFFKSYEYSLQ